MASVLTSLAVQIRNVSNLYQVYQLSGSAFMLGLTGFLETLPFIVFGLFAGAVADAFDRKKVLLVTMVVQLGAQRRHDRPDLHGRYTGLAYLYAGVCWCFRRRFQLAGALCTDPASGAAGLMYAVAATINSMILQTSFLVGPLWPA